jgi:hypothetical protein
MHDTDRTLAELTALEFEGESEFEMISSTAITQPGVMKIRSRVMKRRTRWVQTPARTLTRWDQVPLPAPSPATSRRRFAGSRQESAADVSSADQLSSGLHQSLRALP